MVNRCLGLLALMLASAGCTSSIDGSSTDGGRSIERDGAAGAHDGEVRDAGVIAPFLDGGLSAPEYDGRSDPAAAVDACFNSSDDDSNGASDCEDSSCRANIPACCVGVSSPECCVASTPSVLPISSCEGSVDTCAELVALAEPFGTPVGQIAVHGSSEPLTLVLPGVNEDSGIASLTTFDPRSRSIRLEASIAGASQGHSNGSDVIGLGLVDASATPGPMQMPSVAFLVSGNRGDVSLLLAGEVVQRWRLPSDAFHTYALSVQPGGAIALSRDGEALGSAQFALERPLRAIVYGRSFNPTPDDPSPVRMQTFSIAASVCDMPSALTGSGEIVLAEAGFVSPSIARVPNGGGEIELMALEREGSIYLARRTGGGWQVDNLPALSAFSPWATGGVHDPALRWNGATLELWFTGYAANAGTVGRVLAPEGTQSFDSGAAEALLVPSGSVTSIAQPAPFEVGTQRYVVARVEDEQGAKLLLHRHLGTGYVPLHVLRIASATDLFAFDRDDVSDPFVVRTGSVYRLFFAGRRGLRWSIGMLASADGSLFNEPSDGAAIFAGGTGAFDSLGARAPEARIDGSALVLYYTAVDGSSGRLGIADGTAPPR